MAAVAAATFVFCCVVMPIGPARANEEDDARVLLFSGRDIWRNGAPLPMEGSSLRRAASTRTDCF